MIEEIIGLIISISIVILLLEVHVNNGYNLFRFVRFVRFIKNKIINEK